MRWPRPAEGRLDGRGHSAHRLETGVACAMGEIPVDEGRCESRVSSGNGREEMGSDTHLGASSGLHLALCSTAGRHPKVTSGFASCPASRRRPFALVGPRADVGHANG